MTIKIEIECPYCFKVHVHTINVDPKPKVEDDIDRELPHDNETEDLENFREEE